VSQWVLALQSAWVSVSVSAVRSGELAARENSAVRLHRDCKDNIVRVRVESRVERAIPVQSRNIVARHTQNGTN
jgi:hypothetical protein